MLKKRLIAAAVVFSLLFAFGITGNAETPAPEAALELTAKSAVLMEYSTGKVLYSKNPDEKLAFASVTKVMTMLLIMEAIESGKIGLDDVVVASERAKRMGGSTIFLDTGEEMTVRDLLKGIAVASANDASVAMAEYISGSEESFVALMNKRAAELGMVNTNFKNSSGLDEEGHYSTAMDIAIMSCKLLDYPQIFEFTTIWLDSLRNGKFQLANTNKLVRYYKGTNGLKTGSTDEAKYCLAGTALRDNMQLIAVVMAAPTSPQRFGDATKLLDYGFANYAIKRVVTAGEDLGVADVTKGMKPEVPIKAKDNYDRLIFKGSSAEIKREIKMNPEITAPVRPGDKLGELCLTENGEPVGSIDIVANGLVDKISFGAMFSRLLRTWVSGRQIV